MSGVTIDIPEDILESARVTVPEIKLEIALSLYARRRLSLGKAREFAGVGLWAFRQALGERHIEADLRSEDVGEDVTTLRRLGRL